MRKNAVGFLILAAVLIVLSSCDFNLFSSLDTIKVPSAEELLAKASSDAKGFIQDVQDYLDSGAITEENADDVIGALEDVYTDPEVDTETGQKAAVLAGEILITTDPATEEVVNNVIGTFVGAMEADEDIDPEELLENIFPSSMTKDEFVNVLDNLKSAADAYDAFGQNTSGADTWMSSGEIGDVVQYAAVSMAISSIRGAVNDDTVLYDAIYNNGTIGEVPDPFDADGGAGYSDSIQNILNLASLSL